MSKQIHVLIVEDDDKLARLYSKILNHAGFQTRRTSTIDEGLFQLRKFDPDVVCLDWQIGDQVAESVLAFIASVEADRRPRTMLVSGRLLKQDLMTFTSFVDVIDAILMKPVVLSDLVTTVKKFARNGGGDRKITHKVEIISLAPDKVLVVWEGRLSDEMFAMMKEVVDKRVVVLDIKACHLELPVGQLTVPEVEHWKTLKSLHIVHAPEDLTVARNLFSPVMSQNIGVLYTDRDAAVRAAVQTIADTPEINAEGGDIVSDSQSESIEAVSNGKTESLLKPSSE